MRKFIKYLFRTILGFIILLLLISALLYVPGIQRFVVDKAGKYVAARLGKEVKIGRLQLTFPLGLYVEEVFVGEQHADTLAYLGKLQLDVGLKGIWRKNLSIRDLSVRQLVLNIRNDTTGLHLKVVLDTLNLQADRIDFSGHQVEAGNLYLRGGNIGLRIGSSQQTGQDTAAQPFDWAFGIKRIEFVDVTYRMETESLPMLVADVGNGKIVGGFIDIAGQRVKADTVEIRQGNCQMTMTEGTVKPSENVTKVDSASSLWTVQVGTAALEECGFDMYRGTDEAWKLELASIAVRVDSVFNRGTEVKGVLKDLKVVRKQGGQIEEMQADVNIGKEKTEAGNVYIRTPYSEIRLNASTETGLSDIAGKVPLLVSMDASVGMRDVRILWPDVPVKILDKALKLKTDLSYREDRIDVKYLKASMSGNVEVNADGHMTSLQNWKQLTGFFNLTGKLTDVTCVNTLFKGKWSVPENVSLALKVKADAGKIVSDLLLKRETGSMTLKGFYSIPTVRYDMQFMASQFDLEEWLPADSLGILTTEISVKGRGYQPGKIYSRLMVEISELVYKRHTYRDIRLAAEVEGMRVRADLKTDDPSLRLALRISADSVGKQYKTEMTGKVTNIDLHALHFVPDTLALAFDMEIKAVAGQNENYLLNADFENIHLQQQDGKRDLGAFLLRMESDRKQTELDIVSGDFRMNFQGDTAVRYWPSVFKTVGDMVNRQIKHRAIDMKQISPLLPSFSLTAVGNMNNILGKYIRNRGYAFGTLKFEASTDVVEGFRMTLAVDKPVVRSVAFDSVRLYVRQDEDYINYALNVVNPAGIAKDLYAVSMKGHIRKNELQTEIIQQNKNGEMGVDVGINLNWQDSSFAFSLFPATPILGYTRWALNEGNYVILHKGGRMEADLQLTHEESELSVRSLPDQGEEQDRLQLNIVGINLENLSRSVPFIPDLSGILNTDLLFYSLKEHLIATGNLMIGDFHYQQKRIGDLRLAMNYGADRRFTDHTVDFTLHLDDIKRLVATGEFSTADTAGGIILDVDIPSMPLSVVEAFIPDQITKLSGELQGGMKVRGTTKKPELDGKIAFKQGLAELVMLGTSFQLDSIPIPISGGVVKFDKFRFVAPNKQPLLLDGTITLLPLADMYCNLSLKAQNFQVVNVKENATSLVYGKGYVDVNAMLRGTFQALNLTGNVNLLNSTQLDYVLRSTAPELKDKSTDLVRFVSFRDTTLAEKDLLTNRIMTGGFSMKLLVDIGNAVGMNIVLSEDGNNRVSIQGGGNLIFAMSPDGGNNLVGKYTLSGGMVRYGLPVVGEKLFTILSGSYIEWTGQLANPALHIQAAESLRVSVTEDNQSSRLVNFDAIIRIENSLEQPQITFDLSAPSDQAIQSQLTAFSAEERTKQAMNLLIYGTYSGPGTVNSGTAANNTLNNFVEKELNQWTRKYLKNSGLSFGIDSYNQIVAGGQEVKRTDYSYQFSKQLFNDKINVKVGGRISSDNVPGSSVEQNLVDDIAIEYIFSKNRNLFLKVFRHTNYESVLEGEITQTGIGIVLRKSFRKVGDLFRKKEARGLIEENKNGK